MKRNSNHFSLTFIIFSLLTILTSQLFAGKKADFSYAEKHTYTVEKSRSGKYTIESEIEIYNTYLTKRSLNKTTFLIYQPYYSKIEDVEAKLDKRWLSQSYIDYHNANFEDVFISDTKIHTISMNETLKKGSKLYYTYEEKISDLTYFPVIRIPNINSVKSFTLIFEHDNDITVDFDLFFPSDSIEYQISHKDKEETHISFSSPGFRKHVAYFPFNDILAAIKVKFLKNGKLLNNSNPKDFISWYADKTSLIPKIDSLGKTLLPDSIKQKIANTSNKVNEIYNYTKTNIKYLADERKEHAIIPRLPTTTLQRSYGDCKDKSALASALAASVGENVKMALVSTNDEPIFNDVFLDRFNHVICMYENSDSLLFFDPTSKYAAFGTVAEHLNGKKAFILDEENPRFETIKMPIDSLPIEVIIKADIDSIKKADCTINLRYGFASAAKQAITELRKIDVENYLVHIINDFYYKIAIDRFKVVSVSDNKVSLNGKADLSRFIISSKNKKYIPQTPFPVFDKSVMKRKKDSLPIYLDTRYYTGLKLELAGKNIALSDTTLRISKGGSYFSLDVKNRANLVHLDYRLKTNERIFNSEKENFLIFINEYLKAKKKLLTIQKP